MGDLVYFPGAKPNKDMALELLDQLKEAVESDNNNALKGLIAIVLTENDEGISRVAYYLGEAVEDAASAVGYLEAAKMDLFLS